MKTGVSLSLLLALSCSAVAQEQKVSVPPVFNIFELVIKQDKNNAFNNLAEKNITASVTSEPGTLAMYSARCLAAMPPHTRNRRGKSTHRNG